ncbi:MAG: hypothetical protein GXO25_07890 [Euryarchaeota archaeon]|nr:hypothetical protein [Euryarchaeota archaeon]
MQEEEFSKIFDFLSTCHGKWAWVDLITIMGPTKIERVFKEKLERDVLNHWSPSVPEGYLEVLSEPPLVIHWVIGEEDRIAGMNCVDDVDFDEIDRSLASTIIHNSVIRIMSEKF